MPFVTEYNTSLILQQINGDKQEDLQRWDPYKRVIYFLNKSDKKKLMNFKNFYENSSEVSCEIYIPINNVDSKEYVYFGGKPSYHKYETCEKLSSSFVNFKIPNEIRDAGEDKVIEFRQWFKENEKIFLEKPDLYQARLDTKFGLKKSIEKIEHNNSGFSYKENLSLEEVEIRIESLLKNANKYYNRDQVRKNILKRYQKSTFLAFRKDAIEFNPKIPDKVIKGILREFYFLFIQPTIFYLKEYFRISNNSDIEISEKIFEQLNFKRCAICYSETFDQNLKNLSEKRKILVEKFGDYEFPIEPTKFYPKDLENSDSKIAFIYARVFRRTIIEPEEDSLGKYYIYLIEYINHNNLYCYAKSKIYEDEIEKIKLFRKYITKIEKNKKTNIKIFTTYAYEI